MPLNKSESDYLIGDTTMTPMFGQLFEGSKDLLFLSRSLVDDDEHAVISNNYYYAVIRQILGTVLPLLLGIVIGIWLGNQQSRQKQKSFSTIISSWFTSVFSITKFWVKFQVSNVKGLSKNNNNNGVNNKKNKLVMDSSSSSNNYTSSNGIKNTTSTIELKKNYVDTIRESGIQDELLPKHIAVIMDGNRRYGKRKYGKGSMGHFDGGQKALQVIEWLSTEGIQHLSLYAFSTENYNRSSSEVNTLMGLFLQFVENDLRPVVFNRKVRVKHIYTDKDHIPINLYNAIQQLCNETSNHTGLTLNVCLSYGSRGEIINTCKTLCTKCINGTIQNVNDITEEIFTKHLLTNHSIDPDILIRTSGEERLSNFLLWQLAYTELYFIKDKDWPELDKDDFLYIIKSYANGTRQRRFGK